MEIKDSAFRLASNILEYFEDHGQKLSREDDNIFTFVGDVEFLIKLNILPSKFQRQLNDEQVNEIVDYQKRVYQSKNKFEIFNCLYITFCEKIKDPYQLIDGQHRFSAFCKLYQIFGNFKIEYKIIICKNEDEMYSFFEIINKSRPLVLHRNRNEGEVMRKLISHMKQRYKIYIKLTDNPRVPNINLDTFEIKIREYNVISKCLDADIDLVDVIESLNNYYIFVKENHPELWHEWGVSQHHVDLQKPYFLLGLYRNYEWISHLLRHILDKVPFDTFPHRSCISTERITKKLRKELWKRHFGDKREGTCFCCDDPIEEDNYHAGHVVARVKGGDTKIDNLRPICQSCNKDMLIENLDEYKQRINRQLN
jgi:5-methylcytosine-specific restriction endonuclease McrA